MYEVPIKFAKEFNIWDFDENTFFDIIGANQTKEKKGKEMTKTKAKVKKSKTKKKAQNYNANNKDFYYKNILSPFKDLLENSVEYKEIKGTEKDLIGDTTSFDIVCEWVFGYIKNSITHDKKQKKPSVSEKANSHVEAVFNVNNFANYKQKLGLVRRDRINSYNCPILGSDIDIIAKNCDFGMEEKLIKKQIRKELINLLKIRSQKETIKLSNGKSINVPIIGKKTLIFLNQFLKQEGEELVIPTETLPQPQTVKENNDQLLNQMEKMGVVEKHFEVEIGGLKVKVNTTDKDMEKDVENTAKGLRKALGLK